MFYVHVSMFRSQRAHQVSKLSGQIQARLRSSANSHGHAVKEHMLPDELLYHTYGSSQYCVSNLQHDPPVPGKDSFPPRYSVLDRQQKVRRPSVGWGTAEAASRLSSMVGSGDVRSSGRGGAEPH